MRFIGESINEAIDWTQDKLSSTRPIAETVLFSLLADKKAQETAHGFVLMEDGDDDELIRRKSHAGHRPRFRFHAKRMGNNYIDVIKRDEVNPPNDDTDDQDERERTQS